MDEKITVLLITALAIVVGLTSSFVPEMAAYALGIVSIVVATQLLKKKVPEFKQQAAGMIFLYVSLWIIFWTLAVNV